MKYTTLILTFVLFGFTILKIPEGITDAIRNGNSEKLATFFNSSIELVVLDNEAVYSKVQAERIVRDFFTKHTPREFTLIHQGDKGGSQYAIGNLVSPSDIFRVYFYLKNTDGKSYIQQLRIEKE